MWAGDRVRLEICEQGLNDKDKWPVEALLAAESLEIPAFGLDTLPQRYVDDGLRGSRPSPSLLRLEAAVHFPVGRHRLLIRARSAARLTVGDKIIAETPFPPINGGDGSQAWAEHLIPLDLGEGFRFAPAGEYERIGEYESTGGPREVRLEAFVGGREGKAFRRVEVGETVVAISWAGTSQWELLTPAAARTPYTDADWDEYSRGLSKEFDRRNAAARAALREKNAAWWDRRRDAAAAWLATTQVVPVPEVSAEFPVNNAIDQFLVAKFSEVKSQNRHVSPQAIDFFRDVKPLLESRCLDCHRGAKANGGLRLDSLLTAQLGGDSGPAVIPGDVQKSTLLDRVRSHDDGYSMPPNGARLSETEISTLEQWIIEGATWPELPLVRSELAAAADDLTYLRRVTLDTIGILPTADEARAFMGDPSPRKRSALIERLLSDQRWADHWMGFWQDLLAENPNILNSTLNNTGPFRWWLYEALQDDLPVDRMVTQLVLQRGGKREGGPAGFGEASQNDSPYATKGTVISAAFLGVELKCARCHDSPQGSTLQEELFQLGAMLAAEPLDVPKTSSVDAEHLETGGRKALISVTLKPGSQVAPQWPFPALADPALADSLAQNPSDPREKLAALLTAPHNERFAQVLVNRLWQRFMGRGIVEPLDDWEKGSPTHAELLRWLGHELVRERYQLKPIAKLILSSAAYQRAVDPLLATPDPLYTAAEPRRLSAEQVVDSLFAATGAPFCVERVCLDLNGRRDTNSAVDLGQPHRAWMLASLSNERDRPSLTLPRLQAVVDVMSAFGWRGARQDSASVRDTSSNALQPAILAHGIMSSWLTRFSDDHELTAVVLCDQTVEALVDELFLRLLTRPPTKQERQQYVAYLSPEYCDRILSNPLPVKPVHLAPKLVTWTNHLLPESNIVKQEMEVAARRGNPPSPRLLPAWRIRCEDVIWALINSPEMIYRP